MAPSIGFHHRQWHSQSPIMHYRNLEFNSPDLHHSQWDFHNKDSGGHTDIRDLPEHAFIAIAENVVWRNG